MEVDEDDEAAATGVRAGGDAATPPRRPARLGRAAGQLLPEVEAEVEAAAAAAWRVSRAREESMRERETRDGKGEMKRERRKKRAVARHSLQLLLRRSF